MQPRNISGGSQEEESALRAHGPLAIAAATMTAVGLTTGLVTSSSAHASSGDWGLNGTYVATSLGEWAKTDERYQNEVTVKSTWRISTTCTSSIECTGTVTSDLGWSTPIKTTTGVWYAKRSVANWEPCQDGTA